jgi:hypothetical protein
VLEFALSRAASASYSLVALAAGDADATTLHHRIARRTGRPGDRDAHSRSSSVAIVGGCRARRPHFNEMQH